MTIATLGQALSAYGATLKRMQGESPSAAVPDATGPSFAGLLRTELEAGKASLRAGEAKSVEALTGKVDNGLKELTETTGGLALWVHHQDLADIAAPIVRFADEMCTVSADDLPDPSLFASGIELFAAYSTWCERHGHNPGSDVAMGKALFAAFNGKVRKYRPRINGKPTWGYQGIALIPKHSRIVASGPVR